VRKESGYCCSAYNMTLPSRAVKQLSSPGAGLHASGNRTSSAVYATMSSTSKKLVSIERAAEL